MAEELNGQTMKTPIADFLRSWNGEYVAIGTSFILLAWYLHKKAPYTVRVLGVLCILSWFAEMYEDSLPVPFGDTINSEIQWALNYLYSWMLPILLEKRTALHSAFISALFLRFWWYPKTNITMGFGTVGFDYLIPECKRKGRTLSQEIAKRMRTRKIVPMPPIFPNGWIPILESRDLRKGRAKSVIAIGQDLAVFRGHDGTVYVLNAKCTHLGANLAVGGRVIGNCLQCPFHCWEFNGATGRCTKIPKEETIPASANTKSWDVQEVNGMIHIWYHADDLPPTWDIPVIQEIEDGSWSYRGRTEHDVFCHIQEIPENGADVRHLEALHSETIFAGTRLENFYKSWNILTHTWNADWKLCDEPERSHMASISLSHHMKMFNFEIPLTKAKFDIQQIGPTVVHLRLNSSFGKGVFIQSIIPELPFQQRLVHQFYAEFKFPQSISSLYLTMENIMVQRDIVIWNNKTFMQNPVFVRGDRLIKRFRRWYTQFYSESSITIQMVKEQSLEF